MMTCDLILFSFAEYQLYFDRSSNGPVEWIHVINILRKERIFN